MTSIDIVQHRLINQHISQPKFKEPVEVVAWLGAVQAQDYASARWAVGLRLLAATETGIEQAIIDKKIVRTWALRGTLHLLAAADIHWILALLSPRMINSYATHYRRFGLDAVTIAKSQDIMIKTLQAGKQLIRQELFEALEQRGIAAQGLRGAHILYRAALNGVICLGALRGKQVTYTLLDEWVPKMLAKTRDEALAEFARRYFTSHGPATLKDFTWWSGLPAADARAGLEMTKPLLMQETMEGQTYWQSQDISIAIDLEQKTYLLPAFDEYLLGYKDRSAGLDGRYSRQVIQSNGIFNPTIVMNGQVQGTWRRTIKKNTVELEINPFVSFSKSDHQTIAVAAQSYAGFVDRLLGLKA